MFNIHLYLCKLFQAPASLAHIFKEMNVTSFFSDHFATMCPHLRKKAFASAFKWQRRRSYVMFLFGQGYILGSSTVGSDAYVNFSPSDLLFEVEDMYHYICKYL